MDRNADMADRISKIDVNLEVDRERIIKTFKIDIKFYKQDYLRKCDEL